MLFIQDAGTPHVEWYRADAWRLGKRGIQGPNGMVMEFRSNWTRYDNKAGG